MRPSAVAVAKEASWDPFPPVDTMVVLLPERSYTSRHGRVNSSSSSSQTPSVSPLTSGSLVSSQTFEPSAEAPQQFASNAPLPPFGPSDNFVVVPPERS